MAELNARIIAKASATAAEEPLAGDLEVAELAVNTADGKLFTKHTDGSVVTISGGGGGGGAVDSVNGQTGAVELGLGDMDNVAPDGDPYYANVALLLLGEGADAGTTITDSSSNGFPVNFSSGVTTSTAQFKYGSSSLRMDSGRVLFSDEAAFSLGSADFTIEAWVRADSVATAFTVASHQDSANNNSAWAFFWDQPYGELRFRYTETGSVFFTIGNAWSPSADTWYHLAAVRNGNDLLMFVDGVQIGSAGSITTPIYDSSRPLTVGSYELSSGYTNELTGYMDNFRLTPGIARYTTNFTPGDALAAAGPADGQVLTWVDANSQWEPGDLSINDLSDVDAAPLTVSPAQLYTTYDSNWPTITQGEWGGNGIDKTTLYMHVDDSTGTPFEPVTTSGSNKSMQIRFQTSGTDYGWVDYVVDVSTISGDIKQLAMVSPTEHPEAPGNYTSIEFRTQASAQASDGQVLTYNGTASEWQPADLDGAAVRVALGIGEYVDDTAAGTGGVVSGAMYYNTTSSDYRLKS